MYIAHFISTGVIGGNKAKLLEQPIPASYLKLEERIRELVMMCQSQPDMSPVKKEYEFYEMVQDIIPNPRELNQAVTFLHENGTYFEIREKNTSTCTLYMYIMHQCSRKHMFILYYKIM